MININNAQKIFYNKVLPQTKLFHHLLIFTLDQVKREYQKLDYVLYKTKKNIYNIVSMNLSVLK